MVKASKRKEVLREIGSNMPALSHFVGKSDGVGFDVLKSEVVNWLMEQPGIRNWVFDKVREAGGIKYDEATNTWKGIKHLGL